MPYVQQADIVALIPPDFLTEALDDNNDGIADAGLWDTIAQQVSDAIDGKIGVRYAVPLAPNTAQYPLTSGYPPIVVNAARVFAVEMLYDRRRVGDAKNPMSSRANALRGELERIGAGQFPLDPAENRADPTASVISAPLQSVPHGGRLAV